MPGKTGPTKAKNPKPEPVEESESVGAEVENATIEVEVSVVEELKAELEESNRQREMVAQALAESQQRQPAPAYSDVGDGKRIDDEEYGPYKDYTFVPTEFGEYAVPVGKVLFFIGKLKLNNDTKRMELKPYPAYRAATDEEMTDKGVPRRAPLRADQIKPTVAAK